VRAKRDPHFKGLTHPINFNPGIIKGGDWASSVPAWCDIDCRIAILPGWSVADAQAEILACVANAARDHRFLSNNPPQVEWSGFLSEGYELKDSAAAEAAFGKAFNAVYGGAVEDLVFTALTDTRFYGLNYPEPVLRCQRRSDARLQRICRSGLAEKIDQGHRIVHRGMVRRGKGLNISLRERGFWIASLLRSQ
jgi:acetylornithine deacetylase/succinyl-diaminopimelate desuccinylase-like protein